MANLSCSVMVITQRCPEPPSSLMTVMPCYGLTALCLGWILILVPNPLSITVLRSTGELPNIRNVLADIMGLTKINYNACNYNDGLPVTIRFANKVGDVLTMGSARDAERQPLKFYV
jgi:hypothetical protein